MFLLPNGEQRKVIDAAVGNIDIVPTILDYFEIESDDFGFEGSSLRPLIDGTAPVQLRVRRRRTYRSVDDGRFHLILDPLMIISLSSTPERTLSSRDDLYDPSHPEFGSVR